MRGRTIIFGIILGLAGFGLGLMAQAPQQEPHSGDIISGGDIGFRVDSMHGERVAGTLVVRVGERWVETEPAPPPPVLPSPSR